jgi:hypothetical protein
MQADLQPNETLDLAAAWILTRDSRDQAIIPEMRKRFGLSTGECIEAIGMAKMLRLQMTGGAHDVRS